MVQPADEVDDIVQSWRRERPDLDVEPLEVLSRLSRIAQLLDDHRQQAFAQHGLAPHEFDVLAALRRSGTELSPGQLIACTHVASGTMSHRLARLAERRLIGRRVDPVDRRQSLVRITAAGRRRVDAAFERLVVGERELLAALPARRRTRVADDLRVLLAALSSR